MCAHARGGEGGVTSTAWRKPLRLSDKLISSTPWAACHAAALRFKKGKSCSNDPFIGMNIVRTVRRVGSVGPQLPAAGQRPWDSADWCALQVDCSRNDELLI